MKLSKLILSMTLGMGLMAAAQAQTTLKIGYATTATSHYGVGSTTFCEEIEKGTQTATNASISRRLLWVVSVK